MMRASLLALALLAAACSPTAEQPQTPTVETPQEVADAMPQTADEATAADTCGAAAFQNLIGTPIANIDASTLPEGARVLTPDMMVTQDFRPDRLNVISGTDGLVSSLRCY